MWSDEPGFSEVSWRRVRIVGKPTSDLRAARLGVVRHRFDWLACIDRLRHGSVRQVTILSSIGRQHRSRCRTLLIDTAVGRDDVECVLRQNRQCTPGSSTPPTRKANPLGVVRPVGEAPGRDRFVMYRFLDRRWLTRRPQTALTLLLVGPERTTSANSCLAHTAGSLRGEQPAHLLCAASSSDGAARRAAHIRRSRAFCRSGHGHERSPATPASTEAGGPCPLRRSALLGLVFGNPDSRPSCAQYRRVRTESLTAKVRRSVGSHRADDLLREAEDRLDVEGMAEIHDEVFSAETAQVSQSFDPLLGRCVGRG